MPDRCISLHHLFPNPLLVPISSSGFKRHLGGVVQACVCLEVVVRSGKIKHHQFWAPKREEKQRDYLANLICCLKIPAQFFFFLYSCLIFLAVFHDFAKLCTNYEEAEKQEVQEVGPGYVLVLT